MKNIAYVLAFFSIFALIKFGDCNPRCFICDSQSNPDCLNPTSNNMETQECLASNLPDMRITIDKLGLTQLSHFFEIEIDRTNFNPALSCVKAVSKVHDREIILRGCQLAPTKDNLDVCKKLLKEGEDIVTHCSLCNENGCNSSSYVKLSALLIGLLIPVLALF